MTPRPPDAAHRAYLLHHLHRYHRGMGRAVTGGELAQTLTRRARATGLSLTFNERKVRQIVQAVRREQDPRHVIGSLPDHGYFVCRSLAEAERVAAHMRSRVREQAETLRDFEGSANKAFPYPPLPIVTKEGQVTLRFEEAG